MIRGDILESVLPRNVLDKPSKNIVLEEVELDAPKATREGT